MPLRSAGVLLYRSAPIEVLLVHPGGPFWSKKDEGAWTIPKGLIDEGEDPAQAARREFSEETGHELAGPLEELGAFRQSGGKTVIAYASAGDLDPDRIVSNTFALEWPPRSGRTTEYPEIDRAGWFSPEEARRKLLKGQVPILEALLHRLR